jgi:hypothetical protein
MNKSILGVGIILLGSLALIIINVITNYSTGGEVDYYLVKETSEAAMTEALDETFASLHGVPRIDKEIFMETFIRRFANNVTDTREYKIGFYGINEVPPMVSVKVDSLTILSVKVGEEKQAAQITTSISQLVESRNSEDPALAYEYKNQYTYIGKPVTNDGNQLMLHAK